METKVKGKQGLASMDPEARRRIASLGGKRSHELGRAHQWTSETAREAGRLGGLASHRARRTRKNVGEANKAIDTCSMP